MNRLSGPGAGRGVSLRAALPLLRRRGPDSWGEWQTPDGRVELLHTRLAIVDSRAAAGQPFCDAERRLAIVFNGEVYNYAELRRELNDYPFRTGSDTEVLIALFARWGAEGLARVRGMFACAIADARAQRVYLARDPIGKKPLYTASCAAGLVFGSSVLALVAARGGRAAIDPELAGAFWDLSYVPPDRSILVGCRPVPPGKVWVLDWDGTQLGEKSCRPVAEPLRLARAGDVRDHLSSLIDQSVSRRLYNNPHPVSLLSGGIDSTVVTERMLRFRRGSALTLRGLLPWELDERYARYAARKLGVPLELLPSRTARLAEEVAWALDLQDEPLGMISFFPLALLLRRARAHGKILLTGDGGDEVFLGYGRPAQWTDPSNRGGDAEHLAARVMIGLPPPEWMSPWGRVTVGPALLGHMFTKLDRASAEQGVEVRCPLLDWDLLQFVRSLGPGQLFGDGKAKGLLKAQLSGWPRWFRDRPKLGFPYRIRWAWGVRKYEGLREMVSHESAAAFGARVPARLRGRPMGWKTRDIFRDFAAAWKMLAWSAFCCRLARFERPAAAETGRGGMRPHWQAGLAERVR